MNTENNITKRKKRKTRKCLNEIRKRSRRNGSHFLPINHACDGRVKILKEPNQNNKYITLNRLTLSMFPNAVRSETITRPVLAEIKQKEILNFNDIVKDKNSSVVLNTSIDESQLKSLEQQHNATDVLQDAKKLTHYEKLNESPIGTFVLLSPIYRDEENQSNENETVSDLISPSSPIPYEDKYGLYEGFMRELPNILKQNVSEILFTDNIIKNVRTHLYDLSIGNLKPPIDKLTGIKRDKITRNTVVQNPIEYIRLAQTVPDDINDSRNSSPISSESLTCMNSPLLLKGTSIIQDTPEYNYYPHKLNQ